MKAHRGLDNLQSGFYQEVDGFWYYDPPAGGGSYSAHTLRQLADQLDAMNREWNEEIDRVFGGK